MHHVIRPLLALAAAGTALAACAVPPRATAESPPAVVAEDSTAALLRRLQSLADETGGTVGLHALHLESGRAVSLRGAEAFFMASVTKLPLAVHVLCEVERGRMALSDTVAILPAQMSPGRSPLRDAHPRGGRVTVEELIRLAVSESDNTANDALQRLVGGPAAITRGLAELGVRGIRVDRPYTRLAREVSTPAHASDPRDTATPEGATALLAALWSGRALNRENTERLTGWMTRGNNPPSRIVAGVPTGTPVGHKTGTWNTADGAARIAVNNVGVVTLPHGRGHLAVALFVRNSPRPLGEIDRAMAALTRALFDHFSPDPRQAAALDVRPGDTRLAPDVLVRPLAPGLWLHVTLSADGIPANGALLETADGGSVLFDTGWSDAQAAALLRWAATDLRRPVRRAVVTHSHLDRTGGLGALHARGIPAAGLALTARLVRAEGEVPATVPAPASVPGLTAGAVRDAAGFELLYPGAGHAPDNVVAYFPRQRVLLGGCLVKADTATTMGYVGDADVEHWPAAVARVRAAYPQARLVVPGHGRVSGPAALVHTERLVAEKGPAAKRAAARP